ncbi:hypothetical protein [Nocardioides insulae]|nr:hypothetical protein [Nocardioides insulae]
MGFALAIILLVAAIAAVQELVVPLVVAGFSAVVFAPVVDFFARHRIP